MTAGRSDQTTVMGEMWNDHSVYTYYFIQGIKGQADYNQDQVITTSELQTYLEGTVSREANQTAESYEIGSGEGQFVFYKEGDL